MNVHLELYDVTIIGGGPAGLYTTFYSGMRELKTKLIEAQDQLGGRLLTYPEKIIWDVGGLTPIRCEKLIAQLIEQAETFEPTMVLGQQITSFERQSDGTFILTAASGERHHTRTVILTIGYGIRKMAKLEIEGADRYEVTNLYYTVQELEVFRGKRVLISGGGDSAVDWANELESITKSVTVVHRRDSFGGHERNVSRMKQSSVDVRTPYAMQALHSSSGESIDQVTIEHVETGECERLEVDAVIVNHGMRSDFGPIRDWDLNMGEWNATVGEKMATNIPGIFGAGDFVTFDSKVRLIAGTFTDGVLALNSAKLYMDPEAPTVAYVSSHNERFKEKNRALGLAAEEG
ncbi:NAD(P)/FAD-dependent oxidoreductase [Paenibacillus sp. FSL H7-0331]|uniref:NAD(P)/FAD-dependent oxidoreductase n=1 Tax=Paenibacillus sp. FSL H7-0331 TaxID=1920421 RepID=UPI00096CB8B0|nr:NAD(P)/FAD-dependent oxidoreductase [Paenibacillus sp. FSL H7-0331]OMF04343.1 thioredoxin reductase [Paenibacillus sp. FSL H7-0331]